MGKKCKTGAQRQATRDSLKQMRKEGIATLIFKDMNFQIVPDNLEEDRGYIFIKKKGRIKLGWFFVDDLKIRFIPFTVKNKEVVPSRSDNFFIQQKHILAIARDWAPR